MKGKQGALFRAIFLLVAAPRRRAGKGIGAFLLATAFLLGLAQACAREFPPEVPTPKPVVLPAPAVRVLPNGLKVVVIERHSLPLVTLRLVVKAGAEADAPQLPGTAQLVAELLNQGTTRRSAQQIAEAIDSVGGMIDTGADWDSSFATLSVLSDHIELAFDVLADMVTHPAFAPPEVERKRKQVISALEVVRQDPGYVADTALHRVLFDGTPYSHPEDGTLEAVRRMSIEDLQQFHRRYYRPSNSIVAVVGDISAAEAIDRAGKWFGVWEDGPLPPPPPAAISWAGRRQIVVIDKPDAVQTEIRVGNLGIRRASPDYYALMVANQILGGPASNRLFRALRSQQGLTYGASSDLLCYQTLGGWVAKTFTRTPETVKSVETVLEQMKHLHDHAISRQELETAKSYLIGHLALEFESSEGIASQVLELMVHNLPLDYWNRFPEKIQALSTDDVLTATRRYLDVQHDVVILVGNAVGFSKELKKLGQVRVIPLRDVDLASAELQRARGSAGSP